MAKSKATIYEFMLFSNRRKADDYISAIILYGVNGYRVVESKVAKTSKGRWVTMFRVNV